MREELLRIAFQLEHDGVFGLSRAIEKLRALAAQCGEPAAPPSQPVALPDGWVAVLREATDEMIDAGNAVLGAHWGAGIAYKAMLAAAPKPEEIADFRCADGRKSGCQCIPEIGCNSASAPEVPRG